MFSVGFATIYDTKLTLTFVVSCLLTPLVYLPASSSGLSFVFHCGGGSYFSVIFLSFSFFLSFQSRGRWGAEGVWWLVGGRGGEGGGGLNRYFCFSPRGLF